MLHIHLHMYMYIYLSHSSILMVYYYDCPCVHATNPGKLELSWITLCDYPLPHLAPDNLLGVGSGEQLFRGLSKLLDL